MGRIGNRIVAAAVLSAAFIVNIEAQWMWVTTVNAWNPAATGPSLAGNDIDNVYTGTMGNYRLSMLNFFWGTTWHVDVRVSQPAGDPSFVLEVRRDPASAQVRDGANWVAVGSANTYFFRSNGAATVLNLNIQYRISNVTAGDPNIHTGAFPLTITYTIVNSLTHPP